MSPLPFISNDEDITIELYSVSKYMRKTIADSDGMRKNECQCVLMLGLKVTGNVVLVFGAGCGLMLRSAVGLDCRTDENI